MKKTLLSLALIALAAITCCSQKLADDKMTFYGLDFSKSKMTGGGFNDPAAIKANLFNSWNGFFRTEESKYDVGDAFRKNVIYDFDNVERNNQAVDATTLVTNNDYSITPEQAASVVQGYDTKGKTGLGCVFVVESFDKSKALANIYVVFFDIATKKILLNKKVEGSAGGFGVKNYWAGGIKNVIVESKKQYKGWLKGK